MSEDISLQSTVIATDEQLHAGVDDETIVLHSEDRTYYSLNGQASRIWELVQEPRTVREIRDTITAEYDVSPSRCESDLVEFLSGLADEGLVDIRPEDE